MSSPPSDELSWRSATSPSGLAFNVHAQGWATVPTLADTVADWVGRQIISQNWEAGRRITEKEVADALSVSRQPVREALRALSEHGLVELMPRVGAVVAGFDSSTIAQIYQMRAVLESWMLTEGVPRLTDDDIRGIEAALRRLQIMTASDSNEFYGYGWNIRCEIYKFCGNLVALEIAGTLRARLRSFPRVLWEDPDQREAAADFHAALLDACYSRDGQEGARLVTAYLEDTCAKAIHHLEHAEGDPVPSGLKGDEHV